MNRGFSLVELSIVLVILGLLTGGILAGQSLIRAAELRSISNDVNRYTTATQTFRDKYFALPGDMTNAVKFWGAQAGATTDGIDATCAALLTAATGTATCNGNGNGAVGQGGGDCFERHRYWQHMANAGLVEGQFSGVPASAGSACHSTISASPPNSPRSRIGTAGFSITGNNLQISSHHSYFDGYFSQRLFFGAQNDTLLSSLWNPVIKAEEAWNLDTKMDDGRPSIGKVQSYKNGATWGSPACATTATSAAEYALTSTGNVCALMFEIF